MRLPYMLGLILGLRLLSARSLSGFVAWGAVIFAAIMMIFKGGRQHPLRWTLFGIGRPTRKMALSGREKKQRPEYGVEIISTGPQPDLT